MLLYSKMLLCIPLSFPSHGCHAMLPLTLMLLIITLCCSTIPGVCGWPRVGGGTGNPHRILGGPAAQRVNRRDGPLLCHLSH